MPLTKLHDDVAIEESTIGIGFLMWNGTETVRVWVDKSALRVMRGTARESEKAIFDQLRGWIEKIASTNYDAGIIERDGSTIIRRDDVEFFNGSTPQR